MFVCARAYMSECVSVCVCAYVGMFEYVPM